MMNKKQNDRGSIEKKFRISPLIWLATLTVIISLGSGIFGAFSARSYILNKTFPYLNNEISISQDSLRRANLIIDNAKKIVVEQDNKAKETTVSARNSIVGVFKKKNEAGKATSTKDKAFTISDYYMISERVAEGLIITSDGWIIASDLPKNLDDSAIINGYLVITKAKNAYNIDRVIQTGIEPFVFLHLSSAKDLPVKGLANLENLTESQLLVAVDWQGKSYLSSLFEKEKQAQLIKYSDNPSGKMILSDSLDGFFDNAFVFSLNGEAVALYNKESGTIAIDNLLPVINGLLEKKEVKYPSLGVYYIDLSLLAIKNSLYEKGALLYSEGKKGAIEAGSSAVEAGLKDGDIIIAVDSVQIDANNDLADVIRNYQAGDEINIIYIRDGQEGMTKAKLKEAKNILK